MIWYLIGVIVFLALLASHMLVYRAGVIVGENRRSKFNKEITAGQIWPTGFKKKDWEQ